jgi:hypothetical protein
MELFNNSDRWFKGNLHTHTTISDGHVSPEECIKRYKSGGYDFIAITDHRRFYKGGLKDNFLILSGTEFHHNDFDTKRAYHIVGIGIEKEIFTDDSFIPQQLIDMINAEDGIAIVAHPAWSLLTHDDLLNLHGYAGIEVWNTVSEAYGARGDSSDYVDILGSKGRRTWAFASDDTHFYKEDLFGGYMMVNSRSLDRDSILDALKNGRFYCSQGPVIKQITVENGCIMVETSPAVRISFLSDTFYCEDRVVKSKDGLVTEASYEIKPSDSYVRVEFVDRNGKKAWSQVIEV